MKNLMLIALLTASQSLAAQSPKDFISVLNTESVSVPENFLSDKNPELKWDKKIRFGKFKVIAIGEQSHGTSEFFKARTSLIRKLTKQYPISKIGLEAPMAEVEQLNSYLQNSKNGNLKKILKSFRAYVYECQEFANLVEAVKQINVNRKDKITFFGFDFQSPFQALQNLYVYSKENLINNTDSIEKLISYYKQLDNQVYSHNFSPQDFNELNAISQKIITAYGNSIKTSVKSQGMLNKNIQAYKQFLLLNNPFINNHDVHVMSHIRDSLMAVNVLEELDNKTAVIILAHNGHITKNNNPYSESMGLFLSRTLGNDYKNIGLTTSEGYYTAFNDEEKKIIAANPIQKPAKNAFEFYFSQVNKPVFFLNTSFIPANSKPEFVNKYKILPVSYIDKQFMSGNILSDFDFIIHINKTTGSDSFYLNP